MRLGIIAPGILLAICAAVFHGCAKSEPTAATGKGSAAADDHAHSHEVEGPHGGHIIELGADNHHAELTHDEEDHRVGIHILDGSAKAAAPIEAESVTINVSVDGKPAQYILPASPQASETDGKSSYFEIVSEPLCQVVCGESDLPNTHARVNIQIDGMPYVGIIETGKHDHDHDHGHAH